MKKEKQRKFRGIPIEEAKASIHVQPNQRDISGATQESPSNCAYARCLKRTMDCSNVFVFKTVAYVETLDYQGRPVMARFLVKKYAREYILRFDSGQKVEPGGFVFHRPPKSNTLKYKQKLGYKYWKAGKRSPRKATGQSPERKDFEMRSGKGRVHLFGDEDQIKPVSPQ